MGEQGESSALREMWAGFAAATDLFGDCDEELFPANDDDYDSPDLLPHGQLWLNVSGDLASRQRLWDQAVAAAAVGDTETVRQTLKRLHQSSGRRFLAHLAREQLPESAWRATTPEQDCREVVAETRVPRFLGRWGLLGSGVGWQA